MGFETQAVRGVTAHFGPRRTDGKYGGQVVTAGNIVEEVVRIRYNDLIAGNSPKAPVIPANATIVGSTINVITAFTGGTSLAVGTYKKSNGTALIADAFHTAASLVTANLGAGKSLIGTGGSIGIAITEDATVGVVAVGTFTAGYAEIVIRYIKQAPAPKA